MCDGDCFNRQRLVEELVETLNDGKRLKKLMYNLAIITMDIEKDRLTNCYGIRHKILEAIRDSQ